MGHFNIAVDENVEFPTRVIFKVEADDVNTARSAVSHWINHHKEEFKDKQISKKAILEGRPWIKNNTGMYVLGAEYNPDICIKAPKKPKTYIIAIYDQTGETIIQPHTDKICTSDCWRNITANIVPDIMKRIFTTASAMHKVVIPKCFKTPAQFCAYYPLDGNVHRALMDENFNEDETVFLCFEMRNNY